MWLKHTLEAIAAGEKMRWEAVKKLGESV